jgi:hypothetical protein
MLKMFLISLKTRNRLKWDTFFKRADLSDGASTADKGVKRIALQKQLIGMVTQEYVFNRPRSNFFSRPNKGPLMFKSFFWVHGHLKEFSQTETRQTSKFFYIRFFSMVFNTLLTKFIKNNFYRQM